MVSTSLVTRETREPRRSAFWVSTVRSCTCRKVRVRSWARPRSLARNSRMFTSEDATPATTTTSSASPAVAATPRSEEHTSELQSRGHLLFHLLLEKVNNDCAGYISVTSLQK